MTPKSIHEIHLCSGSLSPTFQWRGCHLLAADPQLCVWLVKESSGPEHVNTAAQQSLPSHKACVSRENGVCVHVCICVCWGLVGLQPLPLPIPTPFPQCSSSLSVSLCLSTGTGNPQQRERESEREAGWSRAGCHASEPSVNLPPLPPDRVLAAGQGLACKPASHISP